MLAWALVAAPQLSFVHALSHLAPSSTSTGTPLTASGARSADDHRQQATDKVCDACLAFAHLGHAVTTQHVWAPEPGEANAPAMAVGREIALRRLAHFQARAPPSALI